MSYHARSFKNDLDCLACKYGTLRRRVIRDTIHMECIDCR